MYYIDQKYLLLLSSQLKQFKKKNDGLYNFRCPYCGDSQKSQTKARGFMFRKENSMIYKCHNCGVGASFKNFLKHVDSKIHNEYILERYKKKEFEPDISQFKQTRFLVKLSPTMENNNNIIFCWGGQNCSSRYDNRYIHTFFTNASDPGNSKGFN